MNLWQLNIFCKVVEEKSFSKAGAVVYLSQPTVSSHIKDLEEHFGCRLIDRLAKEAVPTQAGKLLYQYARRLTSLKEETEIAMAEFQGKVRGRLVIGGSTIPGGYILPRIIGAFTRAYPEVKVALINGDTRKIIEEVISGSLELGVVGAKSTDKKIIQEELIEDEMRLIVPADHAWAGKKRIGLKRLLGEPFVIRESGSGTLTSIQQSLARKGFSIDQFNVVAEMGSTQSVIQAVKSNVGVSILSTIAVSEALETGQLKALRVEGVDLKRYFYLTRNRNRSISPLCRAFSEFLYAHCIA
ncbi:Transcriptional regulator, LysR family [Olavius algarvensis associated proteobacterium Delta 3]|nr:Transcriptional regulator, LysR family [Olavius algarvensis associated proteobacterium Delta 3]